MAKRAHPADVFRDRLPSSNVHPSATFPLSLRLPSAAESMRGVAIAYRTANFTVYRAVIDRLQPAECFRMETQFGDFEMSREAFLAHFPGILASRSYRTGCAFR